MPGQIYALQRDLDMVIHDVYELKKGYTSLDFIAHTVKNTWDEQVCQSEQMTRMERDIKDIYGILARFDANFVKINESLARIESKMK